MALNIPMPNLDRNGIFEGLVAGNQIRDRRRQMEMEQKHHENTYAIQQQQQARLAELQPYLIDEYKQKAALQPFIIQQYQQAQQLAPLERQLKISQINAVISEQAQKEFDQNLIKQFMYGQSGAQPNPIQAPAQEPTNPMQMPGQAPGQVPMGQGQGQPTMAPPSMEQLQQGFGGQQMHPIVAARLKKLTGWDPNELTPEQKRAADLQLFREKEQIKNKIKGEADLSAPTKSVISTNQNIVNAVNNVIPQLEELKKIKTPNLATGKVTDPDVYADYETATDAAADSLMASFKWLGIQASLDMAKGMTKRRPLESEKGYHNRLDKLADELDMRRKNAYEVYAGSKVKPHVRTEKTRTSAHDLLSNSKVKPNSQGQMLKGRINGKEVTIHPSRRELFMEQGGELL
jgi:hypothetical protein